MELFLTFYTFQFVACLWSFIGSCNSFLTASGRDLKLNGEKVYLSGVNQAWVHYADDFGNGGYNQSRVHLINTLNVIHSSGGNSIRIWLHVDGSRTPIFNQSGHVTGLDSQILGDMKDLLGEARRRNILVVFVLWNFAVSLGTRLHGLVEDEGKLHSYIDHALRPMVHALKDEPALGLWEIVNEPEGALNTGVKSRNPCFDTSTLHWWDFPDWTRDRIPLEKVLAFIGRQTAAIHETDPKALVTVGSWTYKSVTSSLGRRDVYSDACMVNVTGDVRSTLDVYEVHTYDELGLYFRHDPFRVASLVYNLHKPIIIGEFSSKRGGGMTSPNQFMWGYYHGYSGTWSWCALDQDGASDNISVQSSGMMSLKDFNNQSAGGRVNFVINDELNFWTRLFQFLYFILDLLPV